MPADDRSWMVDTLLALLQTPSPSGRTDAVMQLIGGILDDLGVPFTLTRRGALTAELPGESATIDRAIVVHADTIGCMVRELKDNGRLELIPVGTFSARFAAGARVRIFTDDTDEFITGTVMPLKASGHAFGDEIDTQPTDWEHVEVRVDRNVSTRADLVDLGINVGDFVAFITSPELTEDGFIVSRHLDGKAGVAVALGAGEERHGERGRAAAPHDHHGDHHRGGRPRRQQRTAAGRRRAGLGRQRGVRARAALDRARRHDSDGRPARPLRLPPDAQAAAGSPRNRASPTPATSSGSTAPMRPRRSRRAPTPVPPSSRSGSTAATAGNAATWIRSRRATCCWTSWLRTPLTFATWDAKPSGKLRDFPSSKQPAPERAVGAAVPRRLHRAWRRFARGALAAVGGSAGLSVCAAVRGVQSSSC